MGEIINDYKILVKMLKRERPFEDLRINRRIILKWILNYIKYLISHGRSGIMRLIIRIYN